MSEIPSQTNFVFQGWNPPEPILEPQNWGVPSSDQPVLVSIDFYAVVSGPYRAAVDRWLKNGWPILWQVTEAMEQSDALIDAVSRAVESIQAVAVAADALEIETVSRAEDWGVWARVLLPETFALLGETQFSELLQQLRGEIPQIAELPWLSLGYLSGFVRQASQKHSWDYSIDLGIESESSSNARKRAIETDMTSAAERADFLSETIAVEWGRYQALYSPMDELKEASSLTGLQMMLNPAAQILPLRKRDEVRVILRRRRPQWNLFECRLHWIDALLIDELSENGRLTREDLLNRVKHENPLSQGPTGIWVHGLRMADGESFDSRLDFLTDSGVILVQVN